MVIDIDEYSVDKEDSDGGAEGQNIKEKVQVVLVHGQSQVIARRSQETSSYGSGTKSPFK